MKATRKFLMVGMIAASLALAANGGAPVQAKSAAADEVARKDTVIFDIGGGKVASPGLWNPFAVGARRDQGFHQALMEPLFILNYMTGKINPWLGESMTPNKDQTVWTLKLQKGATWNDGVPVTADDVIFTEEQICMKVKEAGGGCQGAQAWIKSLKKIDDKTVEFTLNKPNPRFQLDTYSVKIWGSGNIVPKHIWEKQDPLTFKNYEKGKSPVFSGPYKLTSFNDDGTEFIFDRDDNWWGAKSGFKALPAPKRLIWVAPGTDENKVARMVDHKLDSVMDIALTTFNTLKTKNPAVIAWYPKLPFAVLDPCMRQFEFNTRIKPWDDKEMRQAMNMAINRDQIIKVSYEGTTSKARLIYPMYPPIQRLDKLLESKGVYQRHPVDNFNPKGAMAVFEKKGYKKGSDGFYAKDGKQLSIVITTPAEELEHARIADVMVEQFQAVGVNATHKKENFAVWAQNQQDGKYEARQGWQTCGSVNEPWATLDTLTSNGVATMGNGKGSDGKNLWGWSNPEFDKLVGDMSTLPIGDKRADDLFVKAMEILSDELPVIPIAQAKKLIPFDTTYWSNWPSDSNKYAPSWTWWQSTLDIIVALKPAK